MRVLLISTSVILVLLGVLVSATDLCIACGCVICVKPNNVANEPSLKQISPQDFSAKLNEDVVLIDIRTLDEFNAGHIAGAENLDFYSPQFSSNLDALDKDKTYLIYCRTSSRSSQALNMMRTLGFREVYELEGGIVSWSNHNFPVLINY